MQQFLQKRSPLSTLIHVHAQAGVDWDEVWIHKNESENCNHLTSYLLFSFSGFRQSALTSFWSLLRVRGIMHLVVEVEGVAVVLEVTVEPTWRAMWKLLLPLKIQVTSLHWVASDAFVVLFSHVQEANLTIIMEWKFQCKFLPFMLFPLYLFLFCFIWCVTLLIYWGLWSTLTYRMIYSLLFCSSNIFCSSFNDNSHWLKMAGYRLLNFWLKKYHYLCWEVIKFE